MTRRAGLAAAMALAFLLHPAWGADAPAAATPDPIEARAFRVHYKPLADAADVVASLLSEDGSLTLRTRLGVLVVQDRVSVLDRVAALLESFDLPPRNVEVTLTLFLGMDRREEGQGSGAAPDSITKEIRGIQEVLADFTKWQDYEPLGSRSVTGVEGTSVTADLTADYRVVIKVDLMDAQRSVVKFERVVLERLRRDENGRSVAEQVLSMGMVLELERLRVIGAASGPDSKRALFLALEARER